MKRSEQADSIFHQRLLPIDYLMVMLAGVASYYIRFWEPVKEIRPIIFDLSFWFFFNWLLLLALLWVRRL